MTTGSLCNAGRFAAKPLSDGGTSSSIWIEQKQDFPELDISNCPGMVLVAPHPDDETLGFGAATAELIARGINVQIVAVSDGGAAFPGLSERQQRHLEHTRRSEQQRAARILGAGEAICLGLPDGALSDHEAELADRLTWILRSWPSGVWCATTWRGDGHPDHEATGRAAAIAARRTGAVLLEFPIWMWHWASPDDADIPWERARSISAGPTAVARKIAAAQQFRTQFSTTFFGATPLPAFVLKRLLTVGELVFQ